MKCPYTAKDVTPTIAAQTKSSFVTVLEKRDHLATNITFELCIASENGYSELQNGL